MNDEDFQATVAHTNKLRESVDAKVTPLALSGIAIVWVFHTAGVKLPPELLLPMVLFAGSLACDLLDPLCSYLVYRDPHKLKATLEGKPVDWRRFAVAGIRDGPRTAVFVPFSRLLFAGKVLLLLVGYVDLIYFLARALV